MSNNSIIKVKNLRVSFRNTRKRKQLVDVIRGVSFDIKKGEIVGLIGESGSGKSVTARSLFGMNEGSISTADVMEISGISMIDDDKNVITKNKKWRQIRGKKVTYIPQNPMTSLNPTMKIKKQIIEMMNEHEKYNGMSKKQKLTEVIDLLESFGMTNAKQRVEMYPHEFSGGMRQRVVIAMAVVSSPDLIIADEPTTALDPTVQASVLKLFKDIAVKYNMAIIFVSHDISVISTFVDKINVFYAGRIVETGLKYEVLLNSQHPYTWALLSAMPELSTNGEELFTLDGTPPNFLNLPVGDPFSPRNKFAMKIDYKLEPPLFDVGNSKTHKAATWLLHPDSKKVKKPKPVLVIEKQILKDVKNEK